MVQKTIKLAAPYIPEASIAKTTEVLRSGNLVQGKYVKQFENAIAEYLDIQHVILVSSGTAALHLALLAAGINPGDEVIVPAFTFPATANVVEIIGAKPVLVDINQDDLCINPVLAEQLISSKTKAIMPVHEFGQAANMEAILSFAKKHNLSIIEDAACALGTEFMGQKVGTFGTLGCFSLHPRKAITTGEGGIIVTNNSQLADQLRIWRNHGIEAKETIDFVLPGYNYRLTDFQAALGIDQLLQFNNILITREQQAKLYYNHLKSTKGIHLPKVFENRKMTWQTFHILIDNHRLREILIKELRRCNIECNIGAQALHELQYYKNKNDYQKEDFPVAYKAFKQGLALPLGQHIDADDITYICEQITRILSRNY